jgi:2-oxo-4-hydroxy-4-carboxy-5-ureidoimidazoline decarboxylase
VKPDDLDGEALLKCCGSEVWAQRMLASRPFRDAETFHRTAEEIWFSLRREDWLQAFSKHPKIGAQASSKWSAQEQQGMSEASQDTAQSMRNLNKQYERKFGWIFIICATGKSAGEMRNLLESRLENDPDTELRIAAEEQSKIMHLRLDKLLDE